MSGISNDPYNLKFQTGAYNTNGMSRQQQVKNLIETLLKNQVFESIEGLKEICGDLYEDLNIRQVYGNGTYNYFDVSSKYDESVHVTVTVKVETADTTPPEDEDKGSDVVSMNDMNMNSWMVATGITIVSSTNAGNTDIAQEIDEFLQELDGLDCLEENNYARKLNDEQLQKLKQFMEALKDNPSLELKVEYKEDGLCDIYFNSDGEYVYSVDDLDSNQVKSCMVGDTEIDETDDVENTSKTENEENVETDEQQNLIKKLYDLMYEINTNKDNYTTLADYDELYKLIDEVNNNPDEYPDLKVIIEEKENKLCDITLKVNDEYYYCVDDIPSRTVAKTDNIDELINETAIQIFVEDLYEKVHNDELELGDAIWQLAYIYTGSGEEEDILEFLKVTIGCENARVEDGTVIIEQVAAARGRNNRAAATTDDGDTLDKLLEWSRKNYQIKTGHDDVYNALEYIKNATGTVSDTANGIAIGAGAVALGSIATGVGSEVGAAAAGVSAISAKIGAVSNGLSHIAEYAQNLYRDGYNWESTSEFLLNITADAVEYYFSTDAAAEHLEGCFNWVKSLFGRNSGTASAATSALETVANPATMDNHYNLEQYIKRLENLLEKGSGTANGQQIVINENERKVIEDAIQALKEGKISEEVYRALISRKTEGTWELMDDWMRDNVNDEYIMNYVREQYAEMSEYEAMMELYNSYGIEDESGQALIHLIEKRAESYIKDFNGRKELEALLANNTNSVPIQLVRYETGDTVLNGMKIEGKSLAEWLSEANGDYTELINILKKGNVTYTFEHMPGTSLNPLFDNFKNSRKFKWELSADAGNAHGIFADVVPTEKYLEEMEWLLAKGSSVKIKGARVGENGLLVLEAEITGLDGEAKVVGMCITKSGKIGLVEAGAIAGIINGTQEYYQDENGVWHRFGENLMSVPKNLGECKSTQDLILYIANTTNFSDTYNSDLAQAYNNWLNEPNDYNTSMIFQLYSLNNSEKVFNTEFGVFYQGQHFYNMESFHNETGKYAALMSDNTVTFATNGQVDSEGYFVDLTQLPNVDVVGYLNQPFTDSQGRTWKTLSDCIAAHTKDFKGTPEEWYQTNPSITTPTNGTITTSGAAQTGENTNGTTTPNDDITNSVVQTDVGVYIENKTAGESLASQIERLTEYPHAKELAEAIRNGLIPNSLWDSMSEDERLNLQDVLLNGLIPMLGKDGKFTNDPDKMFNGFAISCGGRELEEYAKSLVASGFYSDINVARDAISQQLGLNGGLGSMDSKDLYYTILGFTEDDLAGPEGLRKITKALIEDAQYALSQGRTAEYQSIMKQIETNNKVLYRHDMVTDIAKQLYSTIGRCIVIDDGSGTLGVKVDYNNIYDYVMGKYDEDEAAGYNWLQIAWRMADRWSNVDQLKGMLNSEEGATLDDVLGALGDIEQENGVHEYSYLGDNGWVLDGGAVEQGTTEKRRVEYTTTVTYVDSLYWQIKQIEDNIYQNKDGIYGGYDKNNTWQNTEAYYKAQKEIEKIQQQIEQIEKELAEKQLAYYDAINTFGYNSEEAEKAKKSYTYFVEHYKGSEGAKEITAFDYV